MTSMKGLLCFLLHSHIDIEIKNFYSQSVIYISCAWYIQVLLCMHDIKRHLVIL